MRQLTEAATDRDQSARERGRVERIHGEHPELLFAQDSETAREPHRAGGGAGRFGSRPGVEAAEAALRFAQATLENTYIRAPFTGTVLRKEAEVGEVVAPSVGGGLTRGAVVTMADLASLEVEVDVNEAYIARVRHGQPARITLDAYPGHVVSRRGASGGADRGSAAGHGAGQGDHRGPRPADPARDGRAGGLP